jgi:3',5'-cyclic AMP phosphodiesterase CpdA
MIRIAHISDVHLGPLPPVKASEMTSKRLVGYNSWMFRRRGIHDPAITAEMIRDIRATAPDHLMVTGDLVNIALKREFINAASWLQHAGAPEWISLVPGNHDAYVPVAWEDGLGLWGDYMTGDLAVPGARPTGSVAMAFPYVRQRRNIALIGVTTAVPTRPGRATGTLGPAQLETLAATLSNLRQRGFFRLLMIHHPPLPGLAKQRKALTDAAELAGILQDEGCDLVVHGHNHTSMRHKLASRHGTVHVIGVPSASSNGARNSEPSAWNEYTIRRVSGQWQCTVSTRVWQAAQRAFVPQTSYSLEP